MGKKGLFFLSGLWVMLLTACSAPSLISRSVQKGFLAKEPFQTAHVGISIFDATANKSLYDYQGDKYFLPASNTKIFTLYAGLKYLRDSLAGIRYEETNDSFYVYPTADPTLLHPLFKKQPVVEKLQTVTKPIVIMNNAWQEEALGAGWSWDDYNENYMQERSSMPVYGNSIKWIQVAQKNTQAELEDSLQTFVFSEPEINWKVRFKEDRLNKTFMVKRKKDDNYFEVSQGREVYKEQSVPFITNGLSSAIELLKDTVPQTVSVQQNVGTSNRDSALRKTIYSQPADSVYRPMMFTSDNFYAEQILLMVSNEKLGLMSDSQIISNLLASDLKDLPQKPVWVDGSGLSRYNLFTPRDFVWILKRLKDEFGFERLKRLFPGGGQGTLSGYYRSDSGYIFAKTGTLSGQVALSGYLLTATNKLLVFSVLVNNHNGSATAIRRAVELFLGDLRRRY